MARGRAQRAEENAPPAGPGHNLSPDQRHALLLMHRRSYRLLDDQKKLIAAGLRHLGKVVKSELGEHGMAQIKTLIRMETPEGEAAVKAEIDALREAASWAVGDNGQFEMFGDAKPSGDSKAFQDGKLAGMDGEALRNPYGAGTADHDDYARGHQKGAAVLDEILAMRPDPNAADLIKGASADDGGDLDDEDGEGEQ